MPRQLVISVMARDRVGIVADVATAIKHLEGNLADMSQTVLKGYFTMILVAQFPDSVTREGVRQALLAIKPSDSLNVGIEDLFPISSPEPEPGPDRHYVLTAAGPDKIGLVAAVTEYLRQKDINIEDLATRVDEGIYTMMLLLDLQPSIDVGKLKHSLRVAMSDIGVNVELKHHEIFRATNEI